MQQLIRLVKDQNELLRQLHVSQESAKSQSANNDPHGPALHIKEPRRFKRRYHSFYTILSEGLRDMPELSQPEMLRHLAHSIFETLKMELRLNHGQLWRELYEELCIDSSIPFLLSSSEGWPAVDCVKYDGSIDSTCSGSVWYACAHGSIDELEVSKQTH